MASDVQTLDLQPWQQSFYKGQRLQAEVQLLGAAFLGELSLSQLKEGCALFQASFGMRDASDVLSPFQKFQAPLPLPADAKESINQYTAAAECPDALLLWALYRHLPSIEDIGSGKQLLMLARTAQLLMKRFPLRPDLPYQLLMREPTGSLLKGAPKDVLRPWTVVLT